jgi:hypothetical protein
MDGWVIEKGKRWQTSDLERAKELTLQMIGKAESAGLKYLNIDFHDRYFSHSYETWLQWYMWLVEYLKKNKAEFLNFSQAIECLTKGDQCK